MPVSRVRSEELRRRSGGRVSSPSLLPPRPPPGPLPGGSRRGSVAAVLGRAGRLAPGPPSGRDFSSSPSPREGAEAAAKQRYQSPPREEEEPEPQPRRPLDPPPPSPSLPRACWFWGGGGAGTLDVRRSDLVSAEGRGIFRGARGLVGGAPGPGRGAGQMAAGLLRRPDPGPRPPGTPAPRGAEPEPPCSRPHSRRRGLGGAPAGGGPRGARPGSRAPLPRRLLSQARPSAGCAARGGGRRRPAKGRAGPRAAREFPLLTEMASSPETGEPVGSRQWGRVGGGCAGMARAAAPHDAFPAGASPVPDGADPGPFVPLQVRVKPLWPRGSRPQSHHEGKAACGPQPRPRRN